MCAKTSWPNLAPSSAGATDSMTYLKKDSLFTGGELQETRVMWRDPGILLADTRTSSLVQQKTDYLQNYPHAENYNSDIK